MHVKGANAYSWSMKHWGSSNIANSFVFMSLLSFSFSSKLWSSQLRTQFKQLRIEAWKSQDFNGVWTSRYRCDALTNFTFSFSSSFFEWHSPSIIMAWVWFPDPWSHVGWLCCFSTLFLDVIAPVLCTKKQCLIWYVVIQFDLLFPQ